MGCSVSVKSAKVSTYPVSGNTLQDVWASIEKKGPKDPNDNKKVAALTETTITVADKWDAELRGGRCMTSGKMEARVGVKNMTMTVEGAIKMPKLGSSKLSKAAKKEWDRFIKKLEAHEKEHVTETEKLAEQMGKEIMKIEGVAEGDDDKKAFEAAKQAFLKEYLKQFSGALIAKRVTEIHTKFDKSTKHGAKHGAKLDLSIQ